MFVKNKCNCSQTYFTNCPPDPGPDTKCISLSCVVSDCDNEESSVDLSSYPHNLELCEGEILYSLYSYDQEKIEVISLTPQGVLSWSKKDQMSVEEIPQDRFTTIYYKVSCDKLTIIGEALVCLNTEYVDVEIT